MVRALPLLLTLLAPALACAQGKLDAVRDEVDKPKPDNRPADPTAPCPDPAPTAQDEEGDVWSGLFVSAVRFREYPYAHPGAPYLRPDRSAAEPGLVGRSSVEAGTDFDGLDRVGVRLFLETTLPFGLKTDWDYYSERLACGCRDELWLGDVTGLYRVVGADGLEVHLGMGVRWLLDRDDTWAGLNLYSGFDFFPKEPVHVFGSLEAGPLGSANFFRARGGAGWHWSRGELFAGYDFVRIGGVRLQGPFLGLRVWF